jgi:hypothetical protein
MLRQVSHWHTSWQIPSTRVSQCPCCWNHCSTAALMELKDSDITISAHHYCGSLWDLCSTIKRKHPTMCHCVAQQHLHLCDMCWLCHTVLDGVSPSHVRSGPVTVYGIMYSAPERAIDSSQTKTSGPCDATVPVGAQGFPCVRDSSASILADSLPQHTWGLFSAKEI